MLSDFVEMLGHECRDADNGASALEIIRSWRPDTVLLDNQMPEMSGIEVLQALADDEELRHIPVIMISGKDDLGTVTEALEAGAVDFMGKPFNPAILKARLTSSFERKALRDRERELLHTLEKSYQDLRQAEAGRDALTHMIVHDLGNPLAVIKMNAEMLDMTAAMGIAPTAEALHQRVGYITSASSSMDTMIRSMLDVSKMESGQLEPSLTAVDITALLNELQTRFAPISEDAGMAIRVEADETITASTDQVLIERMIGNLLSNAFKYAEGASEVVLSVGRDASDIVVGVSDNGRGIPEEVHDRIFDKFYQVESREDGAARAGVGLGLAFCRMAADVLGGSIRVETNQPNGTRFVITLPGVSP